MDLKRLLLATFIGGLGMWVIAGIWHNFIMASLYQSVHATHDGIGVLLMSYFTLAILMSYIYDKAFNDGNIIKDGFKFGALIGVLWVFPHGLAMAGAHGDSISYLFKNTAWHIVEQGLGGIIIALTYYKFTKQPSGT